METYLCLEPLDAVLEQNVEIYAILEKKTAFTSTIKHVL